MRYQEILEACWKGYRQAGMKKKGDRMVPNCVPVSEQEMEEDLKKWFKEKWVRFGPDGKIRGDCARGSEAEGKPKCLPQAKAHALGKKGRASAAAKKRREDPNPERRGPAKNVATKVREQSVAEEVSDKTVKKLQGLFKQAKAGKLKSDGRKPGDSWTGPKPGEGAHAAGHGMTADSMKKSIKEMDKSQPSQERHGDYPIGAKGTTVKPTTRKRVVKDLTKELERALAKEKKVKEQELDEKQDACYRKVKSRYKVWPSAYASGALVQCRKRGAANWGNKGKKK